jgi:hypothetical protein
MLSFGWYRAPGMVERQQLCPTSSGRECSDFLQRMIAAGNGDWLRRMQAVSGFKKIPIDSCRNAFMEGRSKSTNRTIAGQPHCHVLPLPSSRC